MLTLNQLTNAFHRAGLRAGDLLLVHSSLRRLGPVEGRADAVLDALLSVIGPEGTLAMPTHTHGIVSEKQPVFHQTLSPATVGALPNVFRRRPGVVRGLHPTHSVAALGPRASAFVGGQELNDTPCPSNGPYGRLYDWDGKVLIIGEGLNCCTFFHHCEQRAGLPWAVRANPVQLFSIRDDGTVIPVRMHPHLVNTWDQFPRLEPHLLQVGALRVTHVGACPLRLLEARLAADWLVPLLQRDPGIILPDLLPQDFPGP